MKPTGRTRDVDQLGRIVIPKDIRKAFDIKDNVDSLEIFVDGNMIFLKKYEPGCTFCGEAKDLVPFQGKKICLDCVRTLNKE